MVPNISKRGHSFKGVTAYLMHDPDHAATSERVVWTQTCNLHTDDVEQAARYMAWTDMNRPEQAGRTATAGNVYHFSLSWAPGEEPSDDHMRETAQAAMAHLGLHDHQYYMVAHDDKDYRHLHITGNLVHPETGKIASVYQDRKKLDRFAYDYEQTHGIQCENRARKYRAWEQEQQAFAEKTTSKEDYGQLVTSLYRGSDTAGAFQAALSDNGLTLAQGNRRGFVIVDPQGDVFSLNRLITPEEGVASRVHGKEISAFLKTGIDKDTLDYADDLAARLKERQQEQTQQGKDRLHGDVAAYVRQQTLRRAWENAQCQQAETQRLAQMAAQAQGKRQREAEAARQIAMEEAAHNAGAEKVAAERQQSARQRELEQSYKRAMHKQKFAAYEKRLQMRTEHRRQYWQLPRLEAEKKEAEQRMAEKSSWLHRYVLRGQYQAAKDELEAKTKNYDHARQKWREDIEAIYGKRPQWVIDKELKARGFDVPERTANPQAREAKPPERAAAENTRRPEAERSTGRDSPQVREVEPSRETKQPHRHVDATQADRPGVSPAWEAANDRATPQREEVPAEPLQERVAEAAPDVDATQEPEQPEVQRRGGWFPRPDNDNAPERRGGGWFRGEERDQSDGLER